jgi:hypothetical protein
VRFAITGSSTNLAVAGGAAAQVSTQALSVSGTNGTLVIDRIAFIVSRIEFEQEDDACEVPGNNGGEGTQGDDDEDDDCEEFRFAPSFLDLPLPGGEVTVATSDVPQGTWKRLTFRVKNIDFDDDDDDDHDDDDNVEDAALDALLATARSAFLTGLARQASRRLVPSFLQEQRRGSRSPRSSTPRSR